MAILVILLATSFVLTSLSAAHGLGFWLVLLIIHGFLVERLGDIGVHMPLYCGLITCVSILVRGQWKGGNIKFIGLIILLTIGMGVTSLLGLSVGSSLLSLFQFVKNFVLVIIVSGSIRKISEVRILSLYCLAALTFGALLAVYQYKTNTFTLSSIYQQRAGGLRGDPNDTAMLLLAGPPIAFYWFNRSKKFYNKLAFIGVFFILLVGIVLTESRGAFVALMVAFLGMYLKKPTIVTTFSGVILILIALVLAPDSYKDRMETLTSGQEQHGGKSLEGRANLLKTGVLIFFDNIALGVGPGNFGRAFVSRTQQGSMSSSNGHGSSSSGPVAHNLYLQFFVENGLIVGGLFLYVIWVAFKGLIRLKDDIDIQGMKTYPIGYLLAMSLIGMLFAGLFLSQGNNPPLWFLVGIGFASYQMRTISKNIN
jgi:hypothetical protein